MKQLQAAHVAVAPSITSTEQIEKAAMFAETSNNTEDRKTLRIPLPIILQHLIDNVVPYCSSSHKELLEGVRSFYKSLITKEVAEEPYTDFLPVLQPPGLKNDGNLCFSNSQLQCLSLNPAF